MKPQLLALVRDVGEPQSRNLVREYLQAQILASLQRAGAMVPLAFHGGTALRFLFGLNRFSEDLVFALERGRAGYDFRRFLAAIRTDFEAQAYPIEIKVSDQKTVHSAFVQFPGLLFELGQSPHRSAVLAVKIQVDTNPPAGAALATSLVRRHVLLNLQHHDRASMLAGKLHALLQRPYAKGRDIYDLAWYLSDPGWPAPNLVMLNNALAQSGWGGEPLTSERWREQVGARLEGMDWEALRRDVRPFLQGEEDLALVSLPAIKTLLGP